MLHLNCTVLSQSELNNFCLLKVQAWTLSKEEKKNKNELKIEKRLLHQLTCWYKQCPCSVMFVVFCRLKAASDSNSQAPRS